MTRWDLVVSGMIIDTIFEETTPRKALDRFRKLYGENQIDVCGVRIAKDGVVL